MLPRVLVVGLAACWSTSLPVVGTSKPELPPTIAKLFVEGTSWSWRTKIVTGHYDDLTQGMIETITAGTLRCEVAATTARPGGYNTRLACTAVPELPASFPTEFAATPIGLWPLIEGLALDPEHRLLAEPPESHTGSDIHEDMEISIRTSVIQHGRAWCFGRSAAVPGTTGDWSLCVRDGELVGGSSAATASETVRVSWGDCP
jgi:hypothetical protein